MSERRTCSVYCPAGRDPSEHAKAVWDTAIFSSMEYDLEAPNVVPLSVEGTEGQGWLVALNGPATRTAKLPAEGPKLDRFFGERAEAEWRYQFRDEGESALARMLSDYPEADWLR